jgi:hypothetical protein
MRFQSPEGVTVGCKTETAQIKTPPLMQDGVFVFPILSKNIRFLR